MDYSRRDLADRLAAEYVLGTLQGPARRRFETLLAAHPLLREAVAAWQERLLPLAEGVAEQAPPERVWRSIEGRLFQGGARLDAASVPWWQRLALWQSFSGLAGVAVLALVVWGLQPPPVQAPVLVVLGANPQAAQAMQAAFVASVSADGRALVLRPLGPLSLSPQQVLELWAVPADGAPRSLGLIQASGATTLNRAQLLTNTAAFAVSVEPPGGSPTGAPTGPIVSVGRLES